MMRARIHRALHGHEPRWYVDYLSLVERCETCDGFSFAPTREDQ